MIGWPRIEKSLNIFHVYLIHRVAKSRIFPGLFRTFLITLKSLIKADCLQENIKIFNLLHPSKDFICDWKSYRVRQGNRKIVCKCVDVGFPPSD